MPDIRADGDSVTLHLRISGVHVGAQLIIRCDAEGSVWASTSDPTSRRKTNEPR